MAVCPYPGCPVLTDGGRCPEHRRQLQRRRDERRGPPDRRGYGPPHQRARKAVLRLQPYCSFCGCDGSTANPLTLDHIVPLSKGGTDDESNLRTLCRSCNSAKRDR